MGRAEMPSPDRISADSNSAGEDMRGKGALEHCWWEG